MGPMEQPDAGRALDHGAREALRCRAGRPADRPRRDPGADRAATRPACARCPARPRRWRRWAGAWRWWASSAGGPPPTRGGSSVRDDSWWSATTGWSGWSRVAEPAPHPGWPGRAPPSAARRGRVPIEPASRPRTRACRPPIHFRKARRTPRRRGRRVRDGAGGGARWRHHAATGAHVPGAAAGRRRRQGDRSPAVVERFGLRGLLVLGDDVTDLDMFRAAAALRAAGRLRAAILGGRGRPGGAGRGAPPPRMRCCRTPPARELLRALADADRAGQPGQRSASGVR